MQLVKQKRRPEIDALRGFFLIWMTLTHLPTSLSGLVNQPFGFVSSAEGFVFLSALLVARVYARESFEEPKQFLIRVWKRALHIYGYHLLMIAFAFTLAAALARNEHREALHNLLNFYLAHPSTAIPGAVLLIYCPPLLDILPMYVLFLVITPFIYMLRHRWGWKGTLAVSWAVWLAAQFGIRNSVHNLIIAVTHLQIPLQETGAFNLFAWQWVWILGLWMGSSSLEGNPLRGVRPWMASASIAICAFFICVRHNWLGPHLTVESLGISLDKWQIGPLRMLNLMAFAVLIYSLRRWLIPLIAIEPFMTLGKASLEVFCAHVFFVFAGITFLYQNVPILHGWPATGLVLVTFFSLILIAFRQVHRKKQLRKLKHDAAAHISS